MSQSNSQDKKPSPNSNPQPRRPRRITEKYLYNAGLYYLQRFPASTHHFKKVMGRKIFKSLQYHTDQSESSCYEMLDKTVKLFEEMGLLDDSAYLSGMVRSLRRQGRSRKAIFSKLRQKGLAHEKIEQELEKLEQEHDKNTEMIAALKHLRRRRLGPFCRHTSKENKALDSETVKKTLASLARAGFSYETAHRAMSADSDEASKMLNEFL